MSLDVNYFVLSASPRAVCLCCRRRVTAYQLFFFGVCLLLFSVCMATDGVCHGDAGDVNVFAPPLFFPPTRRLNPPCRLRRRSLLLRISVEVDFSPTVFPSSSVCSRPPPPTRPSPLPALAPSRASFLLPSPPLRLLASLQVSDRQCIERCARGDLRHADIPDGPVSEGHASVRACVRAGG